MTGPGSEAIKRIDPESELIASVKQFSSLLDLAKRLKPDDAADEAWNTLSPVDAQIIIDNHSTVLELSKGRTLEVAPEVIKQIEEKKKKRELEKIEKQRQKNIEKLRARIMADPRTFVLGKPTALRPYGPTRPLGGKYKHTPSAEVYGLVQQFEYGSLGIKQIDRPISGGVEYYADVYLAAAKCYATDDPSGEDEPYLIVTSLTVPDAFEGGPVTRVWQSPVYENIEKGRIFGENTLIFKDLKIGRHGIDLKIALIDNEHGKASEVRKKIEEQAAKVANDVKVVLGGLTGVNIDKAIEELGIDDGILDILGTLSLDLLTGLLDDDPLDEKTWNIPAGVLKAWLETPMGLENSQIHYPPSELPSSIKSNVPFEDPHGTAVQFARGGGRYKIYLRVIPSKIIQVF